jgi:aryl-phospho-beta-D-glucosidase BglC (GH1 family)
MKKYLIIVIAAIVLVLGIDTLYYRVGLYIDFAPNKTVSTVSYTKDGSIYKSNENGEDEVFEIKGVNLGSGEPGHWSTEYAASKETYLIWFKQMQEMGANTVRIYTVLSEG